MTLNSPSSRDRRILPSRLNSPIERIDCWRAHSTSSVISKIDESSSWLLIYQHIWP